MNRFRFVDDHQRHHGVKRLCQVIDFAPSSYHQWKATAPDRAARAINDARLAARIQVIHRESAGAYGVPRITPNCTTPDTTSTFADACHAAEVTRFVLAAW